MTKNVLVDLRTMAANSVLKRWLMLTMTTQSDASVLFKGTATFLMNVRVVLRCRQPSALEGADSDVVVAKSPCVRCCAQAAPQAARRRCVKAATHSFCTSIAGCASAERISVAAPRAAVVCARMVSLSKRDRTLQLSSPLVRGVVVAAPSTAPC